MAFKRATRKTKAEEPPASQDVEKSAKDKALEECLKALNQKFGMGSARKMSDTQIDSSIKRISTGALTLDIALGGGLPCGRIIEIYGPESCGKTTLALCAMVQAQRAGGNAVLIDAENAFDPNYGARLGLDPDRLINVTTNSGDEALEAVDMWCRSGAVDIITVDSVAALTPRAEMEKDIGDPTIGLQARMMSAGLRRIAASAARSNTVVIFINQIRMKIGVMFGNPETTSGGMALKYYASQRIDVRKGKQIDGAKDEPARGLNVRAKVSKNKVGVPYGSVTFDILFDRGIDRVGCILDAAVQGGVIERRGSHHYYTNATGETKLGNGRDNAILALEADSAMCDEIEKACRDKLSTLNMFGSVDLDDGDGDGAELVDDDDFASGASSDPPIKAAQAAPV